MGENNGNKESIFEYCLKHFVASLITLAVTSIPVFLGYSHFEKKEVMAFVSQFGEQMKGLALALNNNSSLARSPASLSKRSPEEILYIQQQMQTGKALLANHAPQEKVIEWQATTGKQLEVYSVGDGEIFDNVDPVLRVSGHEAIISVQIANLEKMLN